ncbi:unnamed protein product [Caenorhabditis sp. 36 PRJEB53466]|nr:unnamed protein product [Caenorhabditis sp. 36 PRJEB53466]
MSECGLQCAFSIILIGFVWGATNPMLRDASKKQEEGETDGAPLEIISKFLKSFLNWRFSIPFALNQTGSILFNVLVVSFPVTVVVPCVNAIQFISTIFVGRLMGEKMEMSSAKQTIGMILATIFHTALKWRSNPAARENLRRAAASRQSNPTRQERRASLGSRSESLSSFIIFTARIARLQQPPHPALTFRLPPSIIFTYNHQQLMVRQRLPSSTYYTPAGEPEWSREQFGEQSIAVLSGAYRNPIEMARHVASRCGSHHPFFVMDVAAIERRLDALQVILPRIRPSYSVACNADPVLARVLSNNGVTFEVANSSEFEMASMHVEPSRAVFCSQITTRKAIRTAVAAGCQTFVVESEKHIADVMNASPEAEIILAVCLPYSTADVPFGCSVDELEEVLSMAHPLGANLTGIHLELGLRATLDDYISAVHDARSIFDTAADKFLSLRRVSFGNLVVPVGSDGTINHEFFSLCDSLNRSIADFFDVGVDFSANFGRFLVANAFTLCTNVIGKRAMDAKFITNDDFDDGVGFVYQTNDGVYGSFGCKQMNINPLCKPLDGDEAPEEQQLHFGTILGPSLDRTDVAQRITRCRQLRVGEWLVWEQMGLFTIPVDSEHTVPPVYYYSGKECWQKMINKDEQRRSPSPSVSDVDDMGSDGEGYASSCEDSDADTVLEPFAEEMNDFEGAY